MSDTSSVSQEHRIAIALATQGGQAVRFGDPKLARDLLTVILALVGSPLPSDVRTAWQRAVSPRFTPTLPPSPRPSLARFEVAAKRDENGARLSRLEALGREYFARLAPLLVLVLALALPACGGALEPVRVDPAFTATEAEAVLAAVDAWCTATDGGVCPGATIARRDGSAISLRPGVLAGRESGREQLGQIMVDVAQLADEHADDALALANAIKVVAMHEIGHALGLPHASEGLMQRDVTDLPACVDGRTLRAVCLEYDCGPKPKACPGAGVAGVAVAQ
jgi:hypothetical protein